MSNKLTDDQKQRIIDLYNKGVCPYDITIITKISRKTVDIYVNKGLAAGLIKKKQPRKKYKTRQRGWNKNAMPCTQIPEKPEGITVKCTQAISKQCVYGCIPSQTNVGNLCNYILAEGHMRGCPPEACTKFSKARAGNPKRISIC